MASNHAADPSAFNDPISMLDGADRMSATQMRQIFEALHDNTAYVKAAADALEAKRIAAERYARRRMVIEEDFCGAVVDGTNLITGSGIWALSGTGSPSMVYANGSAGSPGLVRITTSATAITALSSRTTLRRARTSTSKTLQRLSSVSAA